MEPKPLTLKADDFTQTRNPPQPQSMRWPHDADTTRRLDDVIKGKEKLSWQRKLLRLLIKK